MRLPAPLVARVRAVAPLLLAAALLVPPAAAAPPAPARPALADTTRPVLFLDEIVVTGSRHPRAYYESSQALSFVSRRELREQAPVALGDVLAGLPGVDSDRDSPWEQRPVLRGLSGQRVLVLVDGEPMNNARGHGPHPSLVDPGQVERIEVVRGPSSVAYGSDALGGAINILTRDPSRDLAGDGLRGSATLGGSTAEAGGDARLELALRRGPLGLSVAGGGRRAGDLRAGGGEEIANAGFGGWNGQARLRYAATDRTTLRLGYQLSRTNDIGIPGLSFAEPDATQLYRFAFYDRDHVSLAAEHTYPDIWLKDTRVGVYWQRERRDFFSDQEVLASRFADGQFGLPPAPAIPAGAASVSQVQDRYFTTDTYGFRTQLHAGEPGRYRLTAGVDAARDLTAGENVRFRTWYGADGEPVAPTSLRLSSSMPAGRFDNAGVFAQLEVTLGRGLRLEAGQRLTRYRYRTDANPAYGFTAARLDQDAWSNSLGLVWTPARDLHLTLGAANGYRQPTAQDLYYNGYGSVGLVLGSPDLEPERSSSFDLGLRWAAGALGLAGNLFYSNFDDLISAVPVAPGTYRYTNVATARMWGGDVEAQWRLHPRWTARTGLGGQVGDVTSREAILELYGLAADRAPLGMVPPFKGTAGLRWSDRAGRFWAEASSRFAWRTNRLPPPLAGVEEFSTFKKEWIVGDLFGGVNLPGGRRVVLGVRNVTDRRYRPALSSLPAPGLSLVGSAGTDF
jgi:outer membrane receptor protein involved in Fe transport